MAPNYDCKAKGHSHTRFFCVVVVGGEGAQAVDPLVSAAKLTKEQGREAKGSQAALQILVRFQMYVQFFVLRMLFYAGVDVPCVSCSCGHESTCT